MSCLQDLYQRSIKQVHDCAGKMYQTGSVTDQELENYILKIMKRHIHPMTLRLIIMELDQHDKEKNLRSGRKYDEIVSLYSRIGIPIIRVSGFR